MEMSKSIETEIIQHKGQARISIKFRYNKELIALVKTLPEASWSHEKVSWLMPWSAENEIKVKDLFKGKAQLLQIQSSFEKRVKAPQLDETKLMSIEKFRNFMRSRRYSESTVGTYTDALKTFFKFFHTKPILEISNDDLILFNNKYILANNYSASLQNQVVNAIKLYFAEIEKADFNVQLVHRPKRAKILPNVLSKEEIKLILTASGNLKHKAMLSLIYSCGLRCGELLTLKPENIDSRRNVLIIKQAKGRKDRIAPLSGKIIELLREYYTAYKPVTFLFEGQKAGEPYTSRSLQMVLKQCIEKVKINKPVSLHWLRHSYATHLLENGTDLRYIQEILGHSSSKTTEIYTHVSTKSIQNIISPFDYL